MAIAQYLRIHIKWTNFWKSIYNNEHNIGFQNFMHNIFSISPCMCFFINCSWWFIKYSNYVTEYRIDNEQMLWLLWFCLIKNRDSFVIFKFVNEKCLGLPNESKLIASVRLETVGEAIIHILCENSLVLLKI